MGNPVADANTAKFYTPPDSTAAIVNEPSAKGAGALRASRDINRLSLANQVRFWDPAKNPGVADNGAHLPAPDPVGYAWDFTALSGATSLDMVFSGYAAEAAAMVATGGKPQHLADVWLRSVTGAFSRDSRSRIACSAAFSEKGYGCGSGCSLPE